MARGLWKWIEDRWPVTPVVRAVLVEDIPGGASYWYSTGSSVLFVFILQAVTGVCELFFYVPTVDHAYVSLSFLRTSVPFGWLIHNLHYWGATAMVVLLLLHVTQNYVWGTYKNPRQLTWIIGVTLLLLTLAMMFTGSPLPWDEKGYWAAEVGTGIAGMTPLVGDFAKRLLQGGETMGQLTLSRFFILHVAILAGLLAAVILVHLVAFRRGGSTGPWSESKRLRTGPFWPDQVLMDLVVACVVFVALVGLAAFLPPAYTGLADPSDPMFTPKPEWPFLFLYQALKFFSGPAEVAVALGLPLVLTLLLLVWPFIDRRPERNPARRPGAMAAYVLVFAVIIALSVIGGMSQPGAGRTQAVPPASAVSTGPAAPRGISEAATDAGSGLYDKLGCPTCHSINGVGGKTGPDLGGEKGRGRSEDWLKDQIRDPRSHNPATIMPAFGQLTPAEADALASYLLGLTAKSPSAKAAAAPPSAAPPRSEAPASGAGTAHAKMSVPAGPLAPELIGNARHGGLIFADTCSRCHGPRGRGGVPNPGSDDGTVPTLDPIDRELFDPDPGLFVSKIDHYLQHGSRPEGPKPALSMPDFGDSFALTQAQISHLEAYVLDLNGVRRETIDRPGLRPAVFFIIVVVVFGGSGLLAAAAGVLRKRRERARGTNA
ncbi:MAG TPA: cytochrome b N-terminal domain-containing protein [Candidatus Bathyarchaeia archaeon]|nr:cytochrome b N-terminal domain-containing protein [Candidatus Bathyarchaeia archaeon]